MCLCTVPVIFVLKFKPQSIRSIMTTANHADHKIGCSVVIVVVVVLLISLLRIVCVFFFSNKCFPIITVMSVAKLILWLMHHLFNILEKD